MHMMGLPNVLRKYISYYEKTMHGFKNLLATKWLNLLIFFSGTLRNILTLSMFMNGKGKSCTLKDADRT